MPTTDEAVLAYIGLLGRSHQAVAQRFPGFDMTRLVRAQLARAIPGEHAETEAHNLDASDVRYVLTPRGLEALGMSDRAGDA